MLLGRERAPVATAVERLGALQAQYSPAPYVALWSRLERFTIADLEKALAAKKVVKATLMRGTLHICSARDHRYYAHAVREARKSVWGTVERALFRYFDNREARSEPPPSPLASERQVFPPEPRLQLAPTTIDQLARREPPNLQEQGPIPTMKRLREEETAKLKSYGWVNKDAGIVRLPIEEAKRLALERGMFPHR